MEQIVGKMVHILSFAIFKAKSFCDWYSQYRNWYNAIAEFKNADVIHLAWINQGFISLNNIEKILKAGKPLVWTMHDIWPATAICHITLDCRKFETQCEKCRLLPFPFGCDLAKRTWRRKEQIKGHSHIIYIACSKWLQNEAKKSALIGKNIIESIPNPIDSNIFCRTNKNEARKKIRLACR